ncbi:MAG: 4Fe-4S binding protein [Chloroflexota bacterium]|nr:4Fe-4S binding protein [Chloroflexota bacterium]
MPKAILKEECCHPAQCNRGLCQARQECPVKALWQEEPFAVPFLSGGRCNGCAKCVAACPMKAIYME